MGYDHIDLGNGRSGIVCSRGRSRTYCEFCGRESTKLCDFPLTGTKAGKTCDKKLCDRCAVSQGKEIDYCPPHARLAEKQGTQQQMFNHQPKDNVND